MYHGAKLHDNKKGLVVIAASKDFQQIWVTKGAQCSNLSHEETPVLLRRVFSQNFNDDWRGTRAIHEALAFDHFAEPALA